MIPLSLVIFVFLHSMKRDTSHRVIASHHHRHFQFNQAMISLSWEYLILLSYHHDMIKLWSSEKMQKSPDLKIINMRSQDNSFPSGNSWSHLENYSVAHKFFHIIIWQRWLGWPSMQKMLFSTNSQSSCQHGLTELTSHQQARYSWWYRPVTIVIPAGKISRHTEIKGSLFKN